MSTRLLSVLVLLVFGVLGAAGQSVLPWVKVDPARRRLMDSTGAERLFHGVNVVSKGAPYLPRTDQFNADDSLVASDIADMQAMGFTVVRLLVAVPGVMPARGVVNATYLDEVAKLVDALAVAGIYTILDAHQDLFSPRFCGNGFPDWALPSREPSNASRSLPFPQPQTLKPYTPDPTTGYPLREDCISKPFFRYYFTDAVGKAFQSLYDNENGVQDAFVDFWAAVANRFAGNPAVLGYEILNEPFLGDLLQHPSLLEAGEADRRNLAPLYARVHDAIRRVDDQHIILYEPTVGISATPVAAISHTGFSAGPGGAAYNDRQLLSYHAYCPLVAANGQPKSTAVCDAYYSSYMAAVVEGDLEKLSTAGFLTEWGALVDSDALDEAEANTVTRLADAQVQSWIYWQFKSYHDPTTQAMQRDGTVREGLYDPDTGLLLEGKAALLARPHAQAVAGDIRSLAFDPSSKRFCLTYAADLRVPTPTRVFASTRWHYPKGHHVAIVPAAKAVARVSGDYVFVAVTADCQQDDVISVCINRPAPPGPTGAPVAVDTSSVVL